MAGLALIVANDAAVNSKVITTGREVEAVFKEVLKFETKLLENETKEEIISHLNIMSQPEKYQPGMKMVFYFVGHGSEEHIIINWPITITISDDILDKFQPSRAPSICEIPKLFFFDCCRGNAPGGAAPRALGEHIVHPAKGNMLVAYSTHYSNKAYCLPSSEPIWSNYLKEELQRDQSIYDALQITNAKLIRKYKSDEKYWVGNKAVQAPIFESSLTGDTIINLKREAESKWKPPPPPFPHV